MYKDYSQAYLDIMDNDPNTKSYLDLLPPNYDITGKEDQFKKIFKNKKDFYRRYRDLSIFSFIGVYLLSVVDAYVDAQLSVFDISKDLSLRIVPAVISNTQNFRTQSTFGVGCSLSFLRITIINMNIKTLAITACIVGNLLFVHKHPHKI